MDVNERLARLKNETLDNQIAFIKGHLAIELTFLQIALIEEIKSLILLASSGVVALGSNSWVWVLDAAVQGNSSSCIRRCP